jgi:hypothetical protein
MTNVSTRGKTRWVAKSSGGAVRGISSKNLSNVFFEVFGIRPTGSDFESELEQLLRFREVLVSNPCATVTVKDIQKLAKKARELQECLRAFPALTAIGEEIMFFDPSKPRPENDFWFWLTALQSPEHFLRKGSDATTFRGAIRAVSRLVEREGQLVSTTAGGKFGRFLEGVDQLYPGLIFPKNTVKTGRRDYIRESLK